MSAPLLETKKVSMVFGGLVAVRDVDMQIEEGEIFGLIGPNGAGKTTLFNMVSGVLKPTSGRLIFAGKDYTGLPAHLVCRQGIVHTHQVVRPFRNMTVYDNVRVGLQFGGREHARRESTHDQVMEILEYVGMAGRAQELARGLPIGYLKRLEIARALATRPRLLLLDEVMGGLGPTEIDATMDLIRRIRDSGITIFMIEHHMRAVMGISDRIMVLHHGETIALGTPREVSQNPVVIEAYLGESAV